MCSLLLCSSASGLVDLLFLSQITVKIAFKKNRFTMKELVPALLAVLTFVLFLPFLQAAAPLGRMHLVSNKPLNTVHDRHPWVLVPRGGSDLDEDDSDYDSDDEEIEEDIIIEDDEDEYDSESEEEEEDVVMVKSAVKATQKAKSKKTEAVKKTVSAKLSVKKKKKPSLVKRYVPYIVRASLSPLTLIAMTKAYFASLFNLNYLAEVSVMMHVAIVFV